MRVSSNSTLQASVFFVLLIVAFATRQIVLQAGYMLLSCGVLLINRKTLAYASPKERQAVLALLLSVAIMLPLSVFRSATALVHFTIVLLSLGVAFVFSRNLRVYHAASLILLLVVQIAVMAYLAYAGLADYPLENMLPDSSSNGITSYLVLLQANYCLINYLLTRRASLVTTLITLFICVIGFGRGSLIAATALLLVGIAAVNMRGGVLRRLALCLLITGTLAVMYTRYSDQLFQYVLENTKIGNGLVDPNRLGIIGDYWQRIDGYTFWTGASYDGTSIATEYNGNPHNSFIRAHYIFGLPYLLLVLALPLHLLHRKQPRAVKLYAMAIWFVVLFRSFTEPILFPTFLDFFYFATCFALSRVGVTNITTVAEPETT